MDLILKTRNGIGQAHDFFKGKVRIIRVLELIAIEQHLIHEFFPILQLPHPMRFESLPLLVVTDRRHRTRAVLFGATAYARRELTAEIERRLQAEPE